MIRKENKEYVLYCDQCSNYKEGFNTWQEALDFKKAKKQGWGCRKDKNDNWIDLCPDCIGKWNNDRHNINKKINTPSKAEIQRNFINPVVKGWELLKASDNLTLKLGQQIKLIITDDKNTIMQNSEEIFIYNGLDFISINNNQSIMEYMSLIAFGIANFEYLV